MLVDNYDRKDIDILMKMSNRNLCLSFKQQKKFLTFKDKVIEWIRSQPEKEKDLLYGPPSKNLYAVVLNENYAYLRIFKMVAQQSKQ